MKSNELDINIENSIREFSWWIWF